LSVKVAKKPETGGAKVYARTSYVALGVQSPAARQERASMTELDAEQLDATAIGVMAATAPDPSKTGLHAVQVRVTPSDLQFEHRGDKVGGFLRSGTIDRSGGHPSIVNVKTINVDLTDAQLKQAFAGGLDIDNTVPTPAQPSRLRVVVQDKVSGAAGSVRIPIGRSNRHWTRITGNSAPPMRRRRSLCAPPASSVRLASWRHRSKCDAEPYAQLAGARWTGQGWTAVLAR
jgi:hypothetical protein